MNQQTPMIDSSSETAEAAEEVLSLGDWVEKSPVDVYEPLTEPARFGQPKLRCEVCGNEYDKAFTVTRGDESHVFDSFECAIHALAPKCAHCDCKVVGHGVEYEGEIYCCANCARHDGVFGLQDRV